MALAGPGSWSTPGDPADPGARHPGTAGDTRSSAASASVATPATPTVAVPVPPRPVPVMPVRIRALSMTDIVDGAIAVVRAAPARIVLLATVVLAPISLLQAVLGSPGAAWAGVLFSAGDGQDTTVANAAGSLVQSLALTVLTGALTCMVLAWQSGHDLGTGAALLAAFRRFPVAGAAWVVVHVLELVGLLVLVLPGLFVLGLSVVVVPIVYAEGLGPIAAIRRSWSLSRPRLWNVLGTATLVAALTFLPLVLLASIGSAIDVAAVSWVLEALAAIITAPFVAAAALLQYFDLRVRREGLDIEAAIDRAFGGGRG